MQKFTQIFKTEAGVLYELRLLLICPKKSPPIQQCQYKCLFSLAKHQSTLTQQSSTGEIEIFSTKLKNHLTPPLLEASRFLIAPAFCQQVTIEITSLYDFEVETFRLQPLNINWPKPTRLLRLIHEENQIRQKAIIHYLWIHLLSFRIENAKKTKILCRTPYQQANQLLTRMQWTFPWQKIINQRQQYTLTKIANPIKSYRTYKKGIIFPCASDLCHYPQVLETIKKIPVHTLLLADHDSVMPADKILTEQLNLDERTCTTTLNYPPENYYLYQHANIALLFEQTHLSSHKQQTLAMDLLCSGCLILYFGQIQKLGKLSTYVTPVTSECQLFEKICLFSLDTFARETIWLNSYRQLYQTPQYITALLSNTKFSQPKVAIIMHLKQSDILTAALKTLAAQTYRNISAFIFVDSHIDHSDHATPKETQITALTDQQTLGQTICQILSRKKFDLWMTIDPKAFHHGHCYIEDMVNTYRYTNADVVIKPLQWPANTDHKNISITEKPCLARTAMKYKDCDYIAEISGTRALLPSCHFFNQHLAKHKWVKNRLSEQLSVFLADFIMIAQKEK